MVSPLVAQGRSPAVVAQDLLNAFQRRGFDAAPARWRPNRNGRPVG
jgi:hypothetical protein